MQKFSGQYSEDRISSEKMIFGPFKKRTGIPKIQLDFQNNNWEFRSLGYHFVVWFWHGWSKHFWFCLPPSLE